MTQNFNESNILICGSPRVGKSTLINAICQEELAKSTGSLSSITTSINPYSFESSFGDLTHKTIFWDTPGIESWNGDDAHDYMINLIEKIQPICMIYCASPGSFASLENLAWMISECHRRNIFCALVCTNMWVGQNRQSVVNELCQVLNTVYPDLQSNKEDGVIYYGNVALVTMVNSTEYIDDDLGVRKPVYGIDELIFGIAKCLERDNMFAWLRTVTKNQLFWTKMSSKLGDLLNITYQSVNTLYQHAEYFFKYLFIFPANNQNNESSINLIMKKTNIDDNNTEPEEDIFHDIKTNEISKDLPMKNFLFTVKSEETLKELIKILEKLGATGFRIDRSKTEKDQKIDVIVTFDDAERITVVYDLCHLIGHNQVDCTIINPSTNIEQ